jgi:hypothetical protein
MLNVMRRGLPTEYPEQSTFRGGGGGGGGQPGRELACSSVAKLTHQECSSVLKSKS